MCRKYKYKYARTLCDTSAFIMMRMSAAIMYRIHKYTRTHALRHECRDYGEEGAGDGHDHDHDELHLVQLNATQRNLTHRAQLQHHCN